MNQNNLEMLTVLESNFEFAYKNWNLEEAGKVELKSEVFKNFIDVDLIAQVVRWQMAKSRSGNHETKTRGQVSGTTKKPHGQKETGKSRQGSLKGPHQYGGGVVFGPHKRSYEYKLNKKVRVRAAQCMLSCKMMEEKLFCVESFESFAFDKTKKLDIWLKEKGIKAPLFVLHDDFSNDQVKKIFQNIPKCDFILSKGFNVLDCIKHDEVIFDLKSIKEIQQRYSTKEIA